MRRHSASRILSLVFLLTVIGIVLVSSLSRPRVMILHSYAPDYSWTRGVDEGLKRRTRNWSNYAISWHYMDTKKRSDAAWLERAGLTARRAIEEWEPDVLIAVDNAAQEYAAKHYVNDPNISIVFAGINGPIEPYGYREASNVAGILELRPLAGLRETLLALEALRRAGTEDAGQAHPVRIMYVLDPSKPVLSDRDDIDDFDWAPLIYVGSFVAKDWTEWQQHVLSSEGRTDYLFVTNYRQLPCRAAEPGAFVDAKAVMSWTEAHSPVPVVGLQLFNVEDGAMLAIGPSPYEQGEVAAELAEDFLNGRTPARETPNRHYIVSMRSSALERRRLRLPQIYESFARATNNYYGDTRAKTTLGGPTSPSATPCKGSASDRRERNL